MNFGQRTFRFAAAAGSLFVLVAGTAGPSTQAGCPAWLSTDRNVPSCPTSGNTVLDDSFPAMAHVVSDNVPPGSHGSEQGFPLDFITKTVRAAGTRRPMFIIPTEASRFTQLQTDLRAWLIRDGMSRTDADAFIRDNLVNAPATSWTWQQDFFESFFDPSTGMPVLREVRGYGRAGTAFSDIVSANSSRGCSRISSGDTLPPPSEPVDSDENAHMGGNIEGLPGGLCLHGRNQPYDTYARYYCGDPGPAPSSCATPSSLAPTGENEVLLDTSFLQVGHADELVNLVRRPGPAPCNFAIAFASPRKALDLLRANPTGDMVQFSSRNLPPPNVIPPSVLQAPDDILVERAGTEPMMYACRLVKAHPRPAPGVPGPGGVPATAPPATGSLLERFLELGLIREASAGAVRIGGASSPCPGNARVGGDGIGSMKNADLLYAIENDPAARLANAVIEAKMRQARAIIQCRIRARLPVCEPEFIEVPDLFYGSAGVVPDNLQRPDSFHRNQWDAMAPEARMVAVAKHLETHPTADPDAYANLMEGGYNSLFPNPTNGVTSEGTFVASDPQNGAFRQYLNTEYGRLGTNVSFVDTYDYAHVGRGNLHCSTHSIRFCRPPGGGN